MVPILVAALLASAHSAPAADPASTPPPNILLILADDLGFSDLGCYGGEIPTPILDGLAQNGLRFTQFYNTGRCWPTRAAILTGYYAQAVRRDAVPGVASGVGGTRPTWARLLPELLRPVGYRSYHSGKWHVDGQPLQNGFDRSYHVNDYDRYFTPKTHARDDKPLPPVPAEAGYYATTAIADHAIECLKDHAAEHADKPFFEFLAFTAPHFPLHAPPEDVAKQRAAYTAGWDELRKQRWAAMQKLGLGGAALSAIERDLGPPYHNAKAFDILGPHEINRPTAWDTLTLEQRTFQVNKMAIHAAMVARMDTEIGRVIEQLKRMNALDNTLILFFSDNGATAEIMVRGDGHDPCAECGTGATFLSLGPGWSSLANTPFRRHKTWVHEGGIATPLVVHWPAGIAARGELRHTPAHVIDLAPTFFALAGVTPPASSPTGEPVPPRPGQSLLPVFTRDAAPIHETLWWQHEKNRALRAGNWKLVAAGTDAPWELYDLSTDRSETTNLAADKPEKVQELADLWQRQFEANAALARPAK